MMAMDEVSRCLNVDEGSKKNGKLFSVGRRCLLMWLMLTHRAFDLLERWWTSLDA